MATLLDLAAFCKKESAVIDKAASDLAVRTAEAILNDWVAVSPVDTSRLVSNWIVTIGAPAEEAIPPYNPGHKGSTRQASSAEALAAGLLALKSKKPGEAIYITNNVPYAFWISNGTPYITAVEFIARALLIARTNNVLVLDNSIV